MKTNIQAVLKRAVGTGRKHAFHVELFHPDGRTLSYGSGSEPGAATASALYGLSCLRLDAVGDLFEELPKRIDEDCVEAEVSVVLARLKAQVQSKVRLVVRDGENWFLYVDMLRLADLPNSSAFIRLLPDEDKSIAKIPLPKTNGELIVVSQRAALKMLMTGRSPLARQFQSWLTDDVLPALLQEGSYRVPSQ